MTAMRIDIADGIASVHFTQDAAGNPLNAGFVAELASVVETCGAADGPAVLVLHGGASVFSAGGDFQAVAATDSCLDPEALYDLWQRLATGPFVSIACVRGRATAGGVGLAAACDLVLAESGASFALSELLFGLFPACVLPFLVRRVGAQRAQYLTLSTQPVSATQALAWGLADAVEDPLDDLLRKHLLRLRRLDKAAVGRAKAYLADLSLIAAAKPAALAANRAMFADPAVRTGIRRYVNEGKFPWET